MPTETNAESYLKLKELLSALKFEDENFRELVFQINRPRQISYDDQMLEINRLTKWNASTVTLGQAQIGGDASRWVPMAKFYGCNLEVDINTNAEYVGDFSEDILDELSKMALEICEKGDVP